MRNEPDGSPQAVVACHEILYWIIPQLDKMPVGAALHARRAHRERVDNRLLLWADTVKRRGGLWQRFGRDVMLMAILVGLPLLFDPAPAQQVAAPTGTALPITLDARPCENRPGEGPEMMLIAPGRFWMGSDNAESGRSNDEGPRHEVTIIHPFALARCETTVGEFRRFIDETGYATEAERGGGCHSTDTNGNDERHKNTNWRSPGFEQSDLHPVVCVSWNDARVYAHWLSLRTGQNYRLPTESEWEYAARAGSKQSRYWGDEPETACTYANSADHLVTMQDSTQADTVCNDNAAYTARAGSYRRNAFGLSDMLGNVWEWTNDCWSNSYKNVPNDGSSWRESSNGNVSCARRTLRGGAWNDRPQHLRLADRDWSFAATASIFIGIRLARTP